MGDIKSYEEKLRKLNLKKNEARMKNYDAVMEESRVLKLPLNYEQKKARAEWELEQLEKKEEILKNNGDYEQYIRLKETVKDIERREQKEANIKNPDNGFSDYANAQYRQYQRLTKNLKPDLKRYERMKLESGNEIFPNSNSLTVYTTNNDNLDITRMKKDLEKQNRYSRRRQFYGDKDVDFINERNKKFNETTERSYGKYTEKLKNNLERGTAL